MTPFYSIVAFRDVVATPIRLDEVINIQAPWDFVETVAKLALARYPEADRIVAFDNLGRIKGEWRSERSDA